ncbi:AbrB/MazE/SpoVT family DNA-binding domain-containing protein [Alkalihalobacillus oceani]|uniref:AbrB/MazE/SpoVT family DNA-binding domain-containing protein n=1 Tax=Halalkalibacter oceani TaxID=1653776 RepID=UPI00203BD45F|nr:AbrB/MazE/SpoVT family DNA-binding domain-containing protein [Halalkalibacter oceani]MCM3763062.1 AbrB/MazE/SpoVT family DNA-binding domain-containing protein [Halalkalibacter oceani]
MLEPNTSQMKKEQPSETGLICILKNGQTITLPKKIRERLCLNFGDEVTVGLTKKSKELIIQKCEGETLDNRMIVSERGAVRIPMELRRFIPLEKGDYFHIFIMKENQAILLKKVHPKM